MCFIIFSESIPNQELLTEFDQILPYPAPLKINRIYDDILRYWNPQPLSQPTETSSETQPALDSKLFTYLDNLLSESTPEMSAQEATTNFSPLHYDLYISTFQFQYRPALMGKNRSDTLLQKTSQNIYTYVANNLYYDPSVDSRLSSSKWIQYRQPLAELRVEQDDPCGYLMIDYTLRDVYPPVSDPASNYL